MKLDEIYQTWGSDSKRDFKRRELEHELRNEEPVRRPPSRLISNRPGAGLATGAFRIDINGKTWKKDGKPVIFNNPGAAKSAAEKIKARMAERGQMGDVVVKPINAD